MAIPIIFLLYDIQIVIDTTCATVAEVQKRGKDFWAEFELYVADLLVGLVVNVALVGMLAPYARIGKPLISKGFLGSMKQAYASLPSRLLNHSMKTAFFFTWNSFYTCFFCVLICQNWPYEEDMDVMLLVPQMLV